MGKKKVIGMTVCILSIITGVYLISGFRRPLSYSECIVSQAQAENIMADRKETGNLLGALIFNEETLFFDAVHRIFYYSLIEGDAKAYHPNVEIKSEQDVKLAFLTGEITEEGIRNNQTITVLAYTEDTYCKYGLKCTTLPLMNIDCGGEISDDFVPMRVTLFDNSEKTANRVLSSDGEIHARGATTKAFPKKGYRFSLKLESLGGNIRPNMVSLLGMRRDDDWLLYAAYNDQEKVRNVFSTNLWAYTCAVDNAQRINTGMEYRYIELFINGEYWGLYALGYPVDEKQVGIDKESEKAALYKHGLTNGEKLEFTRNGDIINPDACEGGGQTMLFTYYYDLYLNADDNKKLYSGIDIDNAVDFYLFVNLIQGVDNAQLIKNYYILAQKEADGIKAFYAPWDLDLTWSNHYIGVLEANCTQPYAHEEDYNCIIKSGYISQLLANGDDALWEAIFEKYRKLRKTGWSEEFINSLLDQYEKNIYDSGAYFREMERWPDGSYADAEYGLSVFRAYVMERLREADLYYERLEDIYHKTENIYIRRSSEYKNFLGRNFLLEINDRNLLNDSDYTEFLEYMGIDISAISEDVRFILANPEEDRYEYLPELGEEERKTCIGRMSFSRMREGVYEVKVNGTECYISSIFSKPAAAMVVLEKEEAGEICLFDFGKGYELPKKGEALEKLELYLEALIATDYRAVIEINDPAIWQDTVYRTMFEKFGISGEDIHDTTDFIVWNGMAKAAFAVDNFHASGGSQETGIASFAVYWNENGEYGVYYDGAECFASTEAQNEYVDIRIVLLDPENYEVVDTMIYR